MARSPSPQRPSPPDAETAKHEGEDQPTVIVRPLDDAWAFSKLFDEPGRAGRVGKLSRTDQRPRRHPELRLLGGARPLPVEDRPPRVEPGDPPTPAQRRGSRARLAQKKSTGSDPRAHARRGPPRSPRREVSHLLGMGLVGSSLALATGALRSSETLLVVVPSAAMERGDGTLLELEALPAVLEALTGTGRLVDKGGRKWALRLWSSRVLGTGAELDGPGGDTRVDLGVSVLDDLVGCESAWLGWRRSSGGPLEVSRIRLHCQGTANPP